MCVSQQPVATVEQLVILGGDENGVVQLWVAPRIWIQYSERNGMFVNTNINTMHSGYHVTKIVKSIAPLNRNLNGNETLRGQDIPVQKNFNFDFHKN